MKSSRWILWAWVPLLVAACSDPPPQPSLPAASEATGSPVRLQLLAINDFHGQLVGAVRNGRREGSAAALAAYFGRERKEFDGQTIVVQSGDLFGGSAPESALLKDEPTAAFFDALGGDGCGAGRGPDCGLVGTVGNHELDEGVPELMRMVGRGRSTVVSANVVDAGTGKTIFEPWTIRRVGGVEVGFVGATTTLTAQIVRSEMIENTRFLDEAASINGAVNALRERGVRAVVVLLHEGGEQAPYDGHTRRDVGALSGRVVDIVAALDGEVDVVVAGHSHQFHNAYLPNAEGRDVLVVQAFSGGRGYADVELDLDPSSGDVARASAVIERVFADAVTEDPEVAAITAMALERVGPALSREVCRLAKPATRDGSDAGESVLGNLVADGQRRAVSAEVAFMNPGGLRADLDAGTVSYGELFAVHPFGNRVVAMTLTGAQIAALLEEQWQPPKTILQVSGLTYTWAENVHEPRARDIAIDGTPLDPAKTYRVAVNDYLAGGGDGFTVFAKGVDRENGPTDLEALEAYLAAFEGKITPPDLGRISTPD